MRGTEPPTRDELSALGAQPWQRCESCGEDWPVHPDFADHPGLAVSCPTCGTEQPFSPLGLGSAPPRRQAPDGQAP